MSKILLIIKAETFEEAKSAAKNRGIHITDLCNLNSREFRARTETTNALTVQKWYNESAANWHDIVIPGFGFPVGTLLFFRLDQ
jgi:hypothetical protein